MVVCVQVPGAESAERLIRALAGRVGAEQICFEPAAHQVRIEANEEPREALLRILSVVEAWVRGEGGAPARVDIDYRSYLLGAAVAE